METRTVGQGNPALTSTGGGREPLPGEGKRTHRLLVVEAGVDAIAALDIKLHEVDVNIGLAQEAVVGVVLKLALEEHVYTVLASVGSDDQGHPQAGVGADGVFLLFRHV
jgi:hypothetical protein